MATTLSISLRKGGSGKTTTAVNLAAALLKSGKRTLLLDLDPQANATVAVGVDPLALKATVTHLFTNRNAQPAQAIIKTSHGLHLLPSHPDLSSVEANIKPGQSQLLKAIIAPLQDSYDYIVIDTPPSEGPLTINSLAAADRVIIPLQAHFLALQGLSQAFAQIEQVRKAYNSKLVVDGILPTMVNPRTRISQVVLDQVRQRYPELTYPINVDYSVKHSEATLAGIPIVFYDQFHSGSLAYMLLAERLISKA